MKNFSIKNILSCVRDLNNIVISQKISSHTCITNKDQNHCKSCQINFSVSLLKLMAISVAVLLTVMSAVMSMKCIFCKPKTKKEENCCN